jgi:hypothetical protein
VWNYDTSCSKINTKKSSTIRLIQQEISRGTEPNFPFTLLKCVNQYARGCKNNAYNFIYLIQKTPRPEPASKLYQPNNRRLSAKLVPTFADTRCHMVSVTHTYSCILRFLDWSCYFSFHVAPQLYTHEAERILFQTHYFSQNLAEPGVEPRPLISSQEL